ncbi:MAG: hypothetical protein ACUVXI_00875 [bacterium]
MVAGEKLIERAAKFAAKGKFGDAGRAYFEAGSVCLQRGDGPGAAVCFARAGDSFRKASLFKEASKSYERGGQIYLTMGEHKKAGESYEWAANSLQSQDPNSAKRYYMLAGDYYRKAGDYQSAMSCYDIAKTL